MHDPAIAIPNPKLKDPSIKTKLTGEICAFGGSWGDIGSVKKAQKTM
jgi:hypothetical protein